MSTNPGWVNFFSNPRGQFLKKTIFEVLKERYHRNENIVERLSVVLQTESDLNEFIKLVADIYETGYTKSINDHKEQLEKLGISVKIVADTTKK